jgi:hypothetical protein
MIGDLRIEEDQFVSLRSSIVNLKLFFSVALCLRGELIF